MVHAEKSSALKLQSFFANLKVIRLKEKFLRISNKLRGFDKKLVSMPNDILTKIASYLSQKDILNKLNGVSKSMRYVSQHQTLWRKIDLKTVKEDVQPFDLEKYSVNFSRIISRAS